MSLTDLTFQNPADLVNRAAFNERFSRLNEALFNNEGNIVDILGNSVGVKIEIGSYVGTGTYGSGNANSLTFNSVPKIWGVIANTSGAGTSYAFTSQINLWVDNKSIASEISNFNGNDWNVWNISYSGKTVTWYSPVDQYAQFNSSGVTYFYYAIA